VFAYRHALKGNGFLAKTLPLMMHAKQQIIKKETKKSLVLYAKIRLQP